MSEDVHDNQNKDVKRKAMFPLKMSRMSQKPDSLLTSWEKIMKVNMLIMSVDNNENNNFFQIHSTTTLHKAI